MLQTAILSVGPGAMLALLSLGIVLVYRATGTLNFAQGAFATFGAYVFYELHVTRGVPTLWALVLVIVLSALLGIVVEAGVMRQLAKSSPLSRLIASLGVIIVIQSGLQIIYGSDFRSVPRFLPGSSVRFAGLSVGTDRVVLLALAVVLTGVLMAVYRYSRFGKATAAVAGNRVSASTLGIAPNTVAMGNWALGGGLGGLAGVMLAPYTGLSITTLVLLVVPALAAALLGLLRSFPITLIGAIGVTVVQSQVTERWTLPGAASIVPFVAILLVLWLRGSAITARGSVEAKLPDVSPAVVSVPRLLVGAAIALSGIWVWLPPEWNVSVMVSLLFAVLLLSLVVVVGYSGQISLAQAGLAGMGAYVAARLSADQGWPFELCLLAAVVVGVVVSVLLAVSALRMKGESLAIVTLAFTAMVSSVVFGRTQPIIVEPPSLFGLDINSILYPQRYATVALVALVFFSVLVSRLRNSASGRRMLATRSNERAALSLGIDTRRPKILAFAVSGAIASAGGVLIAFQSPAIDLQFFHPMLSVNLTGWAVIGGIGFLTGPLQGSMFAAGGVGAHIGDLFGDGAVLWVSLIGGGILILILIHTPNGIASNITLPARLRRVLGGDGRRSWRIIESQTQLDRQTRSLKVENVSVSFGGVDALSNVSLTVEPGTVRGLIGPNGAGKTTLVDVITGFTKCDQGLVELGPVDLTNKAPHWVARNGVVRTWQHLELFDDMTVAENIALAMETLGSGASISARQKLELRGSAARAVETFGLADHLEEKVSQLSEGKKRSVSVARALAMDPEVLVLDEPVAGLDAEDARTFADAVRSLATRHGTSVLLIEHDVDFVMSVCDEITVLDFGRVLMTGPPREVAESEAVRAAYLGSAAPASEGGAL